MKKEHAFPFVVGFCDNERGVDSEFGKRTATVSRLEWGCGRRLFLVI